jgi:hypothetical protein
MKRSSYRATGAWAGIFLAVTAAAPALADVKAGVDAWGRGEYRKAVDEWRPAAIAGDPDAQFDLAQAYKLGRGVPVDLVQAEQWYGKAALQGHEQAEANYGLALFQNGKRGDAVPWLEKAVARGEPRAELVLGTMLFNGDAVKKDWVRAYALLIRSSSAGLPQAGKTLAQMDQYIPMDARQQGLALAKQYEASQAHAADQPEVTGLAQAGIRPADLPGSQVAANSPERGAALKPEPPRQIAALRPASSPTRAEQSPRIVDGGWRVQLGAFGDPNNAHRLWSQVGARFPGRQPYFVKAGALTRLLVGPFASSTEAGRACGTVKPCVPVSR